MTDKCGHGGCTGTLVTSEPSSWEKDPYITVLVCDGCGRETELDLTPDEENDYD